MKNRSTPSYPASAEGNVLLQVGIANCLNAKTQSTQKGKLPQNSRGNTRGCRRPHPFKELYLETATDVGLRSAVLRQFSFASLRLCVRAVAVAFAFVFAARDSG
jgi:hypothetical protein